MAEDLESCLHSIVHYNYNKCTSFWHSYYYVSCSLWLSCSILSLECLDRLLLLSQLYGQYTEQLPSLSQKEAAELLNKKSPDPLEQRRHAELKEESYSKYHGKPQWNWHFQEAHCSFRVNCTGVYCIWWEGTMERKNIEWKFWCFNSVVLIFSISHIF